MKRKNIKKLAITMALAQIIGQASTNIEMINNRNDNNTEYNILDTKVCGASPEVFYRFENGKLVATDSKDDFMVSTSKNSYNAVKEYIYEDKNLYANYSDEENPYYRRIDSQTGKYRYISIFDKENIKNKQYGASQLDFSKNFDKLIKDPLIWEEMQNYYPVESFNTEEEAMAFYKGYFGLIFDWGCGFAAAADRIFHAYEGKEDQFEETFGYPMYSVDNKGNVDFNYEIFMLKFFNYHISNNNYRNFTKEEIKNALSKTLYKQEFLSYCQSEEYTKQLPDDYLTWNEAKWNRWNEFEQARKEKWQLLYNKWINAEEDNIVLGIALDESYGNFYQYMAQYGVNIDTKYEEYTYDYSMDDIIASDNFDLYKENANGIKYDQIYNIKSHYFYVTDVSHDGKVTVSSYGDQYIFDGTNADWTSKVKIKVK